MVPLGGGRGLDVITGLIMGVLYGVPAYLGALVVRRVLLP